MLKRSTTAALAVLAGLTFAFGAQAEDPKTLKIAGVLSAGKESPWEASFIASMNRVIAAKPHGLEISADYTENVYDNAEQVFRTYAETGEYGIIFGDTAYADAIAKVKDEFKDRLFVMSGSGNRGLGGNAYWVFIHGHEPAYVMGQMAGKLTKSNTIGIVGSFPAEDTNDQVNAFIAGAKEVNPAVKTKITFIQSWYDPPKANEATTAQIAAGADQIFQMFGAFEVCQQKKVTCYGNYADVSSYAPDVIMASAIVNWDPVINWVIDEWWTAKTTGQPMNAPMEPKWFSMKDGSGDLALNAQLAGGLPEEVKKLVDDNLAAIKSGAKTVELNTGEAKPD